MTTVYLVRHAHADWTPDEARPLSPQGRAAALSVADLLSVRTVAAIYSSTSRRAIDTVRPLAEQVGVSITTIHDLRERELPPVPASNFARVTRDSWLAPEVAIAGAESNLAAQARGLTVLDDILARHLGQPVVVSTHGTLLALILNGLDASLGYDFWQTMSFPDVYELDLDGRALRHVRRIWSV